MPETKVKPASGASSRVQPKPIDAYSRMLSRGNTWQSLPAPRPITKKVGARTISRTQNAMDRVAELGERNIENSKRIHGALTGSKKVIFNFLSSNKGSYYLTHFSSHEFPDGDITLLSREQLKSMGIPFSQDNTPDVDVDNFATDDFVFMGLEAGERSSPSKQKSRFGEYFYRTNLINVDPDSVSNSLVQLNDVISPNKRPELRDDSWIDPDEKIAFYTLSHTPRDVVYRGHQFLDGIAHQIVADLEGMPKTREHLASYIRQGYMRLPFKNSMVNMFYRPQILFPQSLSLPKEKTERYDVSGDKAILKNKSSLK